MKVAPPSGLPSSSCFCQAIEPSRLTNVPAAIVPFGAAADTETFAQSGSPM